MARGRNDGSSPAKKRRTSKTKADESKCEVCGKTFANEAQLSYHVRFHKVEESKIIRVKVENVKDLGGIGQEKETVKPIDGITWVVGVSRVEGYLQLQLTCKRSRDCPVWECAVEGEIKLVNPADASKSKCKVFDETLNEHTYYATNRLLEWDQLTEKSGFVVDGNIDIEVRVLVKSMYGKRTVSSIYFSSPSSYSDIILVVEKTKFHVSKAIIAHASGYFREQFYVKSKGFLVKEYYPANLTADVLKTGLNLIYDRVNDLNKNNVKGLLKMADQLLIPKITDIVEIWMTTTDCFPLHEELLLTEQHKLDVAKAVKVRGIATYEQAKAVLNSESFGKYSDALKEQIKEKMTELSGW